MYLPITSDGPEIRIIYIPVWGVCVMEGQKKNSYIISPLLHI